MDKGTSVAEPLDANECRQAMTAGPVPAEQVCHRSGGPAEGRGSTGITRPCLMGCKQKLVPAFKADRGSPREGGENKGPGRK